jgi:hypothetical protein
LPRFVVVTVVGGQLHERLFEPSAAHLDVAGLKGIG